MDLKKKSGGYYFDFSMRLMVLDGMIKTNRIDVKKDAKGYLKETWACLKKVRLTNEISLVPYLKKIIKFIYIVTLLRFI